EGSGKVVAHGSDPRLGTGEKATSPPFQTALEAPRGPQVPEFYQRSPRTERHGPERASSAGGASMPAHASSRHDLLTNDHCGLVAQIVPKCPHRRLRKGRSPGRTRTCASD